jgi:hypothetical protein
MRKHFASISHQNCSNFTPRNSSSNAGSLILKVPHTSKARRITCYWAANFWPCLWGIQECLYRPCTCWVKIIGWQKGACIQAKKVCLDRYWHQRVLLSNLKQKITSSTGKLNMYDMLLHIMARRDDDARQSSEATHHSTKFGRPFARMLGMGSTRLMNCSPSSSAAIWASSAGE